MARDEVFALISTLGASKWRATFLDEFPTFGARAVASAWRC